LINFSSAHSKLAATMSIKLTLDLVTLSGKANEDLVSEDPSVDEVGISVSTDI
jgi:hypothetical protein